MCFQRVDQRRDGMLGRHNVNGETEFGSSAGSDRADIRQTYTGQILAAATHAIQPDQQVAHRGRTGKGNGIDLPGAQQGWQVHTAAARNGAICYHRCQIGAADRQRLGQNGTGDVGLAEQHPATGR